MAKKSVKKSGKKKAPAKFMSLQTNDSATTKKKRDDHERWLTFLSKKQLDELKRLRPKVHAADPQNCERMPPPGS